MTPEPTPEATAELVASLQREIERERAARHEAERIAEDTLRRVWEQARNAELVSGIARIANSAVRIDDALNAALKLLGQHGDWTCGHTFYVLGSDEALEPSGLWWEAEPGEARLMRDATAMVEFRHGVGIAGSVWAQGRPAWIEDLSVQENFLRSKAVPNLGMRSGLFFPIFAGSQVVAVMELFSKRTKTVDPTLLELCEDIGVQLGRIVERARTSESVERRVTSRTAELVMARDRADQRARSGVTLAGAVLSHVGSKVDAGLAQDLQDLALLGRLVSGDVTATSVSFAELLVEAAQHVGIAVDSIPPATVKVPREEALHVLRRFLEWQQSRHGQVRIFVDLTGTELHLSVGVESPAPIRALRDVFSAPYVEGDAFGVVPPLLNEFALSVRGRVWRSSERDVVVLALPVVATEVRAPGVRAMSRRRALLVSADDVARLVGRSVIEGFGLNCEIASDIDSALASLERQDYDLAFIDNSVRAPDVFDTAQRIHEVFPVVPLIAILPSIAAAMSARAAEAGISEVIPAPLTRTSLTEVLGRLFQQSSTTS